MPAVAAKDPEGTWLTYYEGKSTKRRVWRNNKTGVDFYERPAGYESPPPDSGDEEYEREMAADAARRRPKRGEEKEGAAGEAAPAAPLIDGEDREVSSDEESLEGGADAVGRASKTRWRYVAADAAAGQTRGYYFERTSLETRFDRPPEYTTDDDVDSADEAEAEAEPEAEAEAEPARKEDPSSRWRRVPASEGQAVYYFERSSFETRYDRPPNYSTDDDVDDEDEEEEEEGEAAAAADESARGGGEKKPAAASAAAVEAPGDRRWRRADAGGGRCDFYDREGEFPTTYERPASYREELDVDSEGEEGDDESEAVDAERAAAAVVPDRRWRKADAGGGRTYWYDRTGELASTYQRPASYSAELDIDSEGDEDEGEGEEDGEEEVDEGAAEPAPAPAPAAARATPAPAAAARAVPAPAAAAKAPAASAQSTPREQSSSEDSEAEPSPRAPASKPPKSWW